MFCFLVRYGVTKFLPNHSQLSSLQGWLLRSPQGAQQGHPARAEAPQSRWPGQVGQSWDRSMEDQETRPRREVSQVQTCHTPVRSGSCPPDLSLPWKTAYNRVLTNESSWAIFKKFLACFFRLLDHMCKFGNLA